MEPTNNIINETEIIISVSQKKEINKLLDDIRNGLHGYLEKTMHTCDCYDLIDSLKQKETKDALEKLKKIFK